MEVNEYNFIIGFIFAALITAGFTYLVKNVAIKYRIVDDPKTSKRKIHRRPIPLLGGVGLFLGFSIVAGYYAFFTDQMFGGYMLPKHIIALILGGLVLIIGGILDDKYNLKPIYQFIWPIIAVVIVVASGIGIDYINNPWGETINLSSINIELFNFNGVPYYFTVIADLFALIWVVGMIYTTKFLDGLDGLVSGICVIACGVIFLLSMTQGVMQPETALISAILGGAAAGFLIFNWHPAKIFLGEGGSTYIGFMLGTLSIISGGKIATALLIMGIPIIDISWSIVRRIWNKQSPFKGDKRHFHFGLMKLGFTHRGAVVFLYFACATFGLLAIYLQGSQKAIAFIVLICLITILGFVLYFKSMDKKGDDRLDTTG